MIEWYFHTHSWNRIALIGAIVAPAAKAIFSTLTTAHMIGLPTGAAVMWACGWAVIAARDIATRRLEQRHLLRVGEIPIVGAA